MDKKNHAKFSAAKNGLDEVLKKQFEGKMFKRNWGWAIAGVVLFIGALWLTARGGRGGQQSAPRSGRSA